MNETTSHTNLTSSDRRTTKLVARRFLIVANGSVA